jgi:translation initiation factor 3 subunit I
VTTTTVDNSQFKAIMYDLVLQEEIGRVAGHFGPVNTIAYAPDGRGFVSGGEDGYVRLHRFDKSYFDSARTSRK